MAAGETADGATPASQGRAYGGLDGAQRKAQRRQRMLEATAELFGQREGWNAATVERICSLAGVATRSVYDEFGSREALLLAVYDQVIAAAIEELEQALSEAGTDLRDRIEAAIAAYVRFMTADPRRAQIAHVSMRRAGDWAHAARLQTIDSSTLRIRNSLRIIPGRPITGESAEMAAAMMTGAVNELMAHWAEHPDPPSVEALVAVIVAWFDAFLTALPSGS